MYAEDTIVAPATAPGQGAVAIVRLSGPRAIEIARVLWHPARGGQYLPGRVCLGEIGGPETGQRPDRALWFIIPAPNSLTGEHVAELHCHGGVYLTRRVVARAMAVGARMADPGEFSRRAFLNGRMDLTEAEAVADLVSARGESALRQALAHLGGALAERVEGLRRQVVGIRAHLEAEIDFADEDIRLPSRNEIAQDIKRLIEDVALLHDSFERGRIMRDGARAAIIGKPNAGKSSVLNLLLGSERAIVTPIPGTTRDVIEDSIQLGPYPLVLQDTAAVRASPDAVERIGIPRTRRHADEADLIIAIFDGSRPFEDEDRDVIRMCRERLGVALLNKSDLPQVLSPEKLDALEMPLLAFSALKAEGVSELRDRLERAVEALLGKRGENGPEGVAISRERHREALARELEALESARQARVSSRPPEIAAADVGLAAEALASSTGAVTTEDVLDAVFPEFFIGK